MRMEKTTHLWPKRRQRLLGLFFCFAPSLSSSSSPSSSSPPVSWSFVPLSVPVPWHYRPISLLPISTLRAVVHGGRWWWWWWWWFVVRCSSMSSAPHGSLSSSSLSSLHPSGPCLLLVIGRSPSRFPSLSTASTCDPPHEQWLAGLGQVLGRLLLCPLSSIPYNPSTP